MVFPYCECALHELSLYQLWLVESRAELISTERSCFPSTSYLASQITSGRKTSTIISRHGENLARAAKVCLGIPPTLPATSSPSAAIATMIIGGEYHCSQPYELDVQVWRQMFGTSIMTMHYMSVTVSLESTWRSLSLVTICKFLTSPDTASLTKNRTFLSLYVNPLVEILEGQNPSTEFYNGTRHGVFDVDSEQSITLLVDLKTGGAETWPYVLEQLQPLRERGWLTYVENGKLVKGPVTVVGTGNTRFDLLTANETYRDVFFDAPLDVMWEMRQGPDGPDWDENERSAEEESRAPLTIESLPADPIAQDGGQGKSGIKPTDEFNPLNSYYASVSFTKSVGILWRGHVTPRQLSIIRGHVRGAHRRGLKVRYWDTPSWPIGMRNHVWDVLIKEGVDMLNVDDLRAASKQVW